MKSRSATKMNIHTSVAVPPAPVRVPSQWSVVRVSRQSRLLVNDKGDSELIADLLAFTLRLRKTPENFS